MRWFGDPWPHPDRRAPACEDDTARVPTPVGAECLWGCGEPIGEDHRGFVIPCIDTDGAELRPAHLECQTRSVVGPLAHLDRRCSCYGGDGHAPPPGMTRWDEAREVFRRLEAGELYRWPG